MTRLVHILLSPLYVLILIQVWPILLLFGFAVVWHYTDRWFPTWRES